MTFLFAALLATAALAQDFLEDPIIYAPEVMADAPITGGEIRTEDGGALVLKHTSITAEVHAGLARVTMVQYFQNPYDEPIEAKYLLPLPSTAAVDRMDMTVGDRTIEGWVMERQAALEAYERAKEDGVKAALLEQERENLFTQHISGICPEESVQITLQYTEQIAYEDGLYELVIPTTVGERFSPPWVEDADRVQAKWGSTGRQLEVTVYLDEGLPVEALWSDTHAIDIPADGPYGAVVDINPHDGVPNRDFSLTWSLAGKTPRAAVLAHRPDTSEPGYVSLTIEPQILGDMYEAQPRELMFVLDSSCSMRGEPWEMATEAVLLSLDKMRDDDTFNLVRFSNSSSSLFGTPQPSTPSNRAAARAWLRHFEGGSTRMDRGIIHSLTMPGDPESLRLVLMLTDGYISAEKGMFTTVSKHLGDSRLFALGIGSSVNRYLLEGLAEMGRGDVSYHLPGTAASNTVNAFYKRIEHPGMSNIQIDWGDLEVTEQYPSKVPDVWAGQPIRVVARYDSGAATNVRISGRVGSGVHRLILPIDVADKTLAHEGIAALWARRKIRDIEWYPKDRSGQQVREEVTDVALAHNLVSTYTSLIAIDDEPCACGKVARALTVPNEAPANTRVSSLKGKMGSSGLMGKVGGMSGGGLSSRGSGYGGGGSAEGLGGLGVKGIGSGGSGYGQRAAMRGKGGSSALGVVGGSPIILGSLDRSLISDVIKRHMNQIRYCYQRELQKNPSLAGKVVMRFTIGVDGKVPKATTKTSTLSNSAVERCIEGRFRRMTFPPPTGGGIVMVTYPFIFSAAE